MFAFQGNGSGTVKKVKGDKIELENTFGQI